MRGLTDDELSDTIARAFRKLVDVDDFARATDVPLFLTDVLTNAIIVLGPVGPPFSQRAEKKRAAKKRAPKNLMIDRRL